MLQETYTPKKARVVVREMAEAAARDLLGKGLVTDQFMMRGGSSDSLAVVSAGDASKMASIKSAVPLPDIDEMR